MAFEKRIQKNSYKYNDYEEVKEWSCKKRNKNFQDINPDIICRLSLEGMDNIRRPIYKYDDLEKLKSWSYDKVIENLQDIDPLRYFEYTIEREKIMKRLVGIILNIKKYSYSPVSLGRI